MSNTTTHSRRRFLQLAGLGTAASLMPLDGESSIGRAADPVASTASRDSERALKLAMASYTLRAFSLDEALAMTQRVGLTAICLKAFHLKLDASSEEIAATVAKVRETGLRLYGGGVIHLSNPGEVDHAFEYAKAAGMTKIIGAPTPDMLSLINDKVQEYDIAVCIHNHGPTDKTFPTPDVAYEKIKRLDRRVGLCHDVGHTTRAGCDPVALSEQCADRLLDVHMKDVTEPTKKGHAIACGRGIIDIPALVRTLIKIGYTGYLSFEYESEAKDPLPGVAESVGYVRGVLDTV